MRALFIRAGMMVASLLLCIGSGAQVIDDTAGKTYYTYDSLSHKKIKEIYHFKQIIKLIPDKEGNYTDTFIYIKHGPYTKYDEQGNLMCSGYFVDERKDSTWKYYTPGGQLVRTERWRKGQKQ